MYFSPQKLDPRSHPHMDNHFSTAGENIFSIQLAADDDLFVSSEDCLIPYHIEYTPKIGLDDQYIGILHNLIVVCPGIFFTRKSWPSEMSIKPILAILCYIPLYVCHPNVF